MPIVPSPDNNEMPDTSPATLLPLLKIIDPEMPSALSPVDTLIEPDLP
jgi:hypothetical protein